MVASRPSTILLADQVAFIRDGELVAQGPQAEVMAEHADFRDIFEAFETDRRHPSADVGS